MRVLFTTTAGTGHYHPLIPLARALAEAGHDVAIAGPGSLAPVIANCGFRLFAAGYDPAGAPDPELLGLQAALGQFRPDFSVGLHTGLVQGFDGSPVTAAPRRAARTGCVSGRA